MTRFNLVQPVRMADQHVNGEYYEIYSFLKQLHSNPVIKSPIPEKYVMGTGHQTFFKNKVIFLKNRWFKLRDEMNNRDFQTNPELSSILEGLKFNQESMNDWTPSPSEVMLSKNILLERIRSKPNFYRYKGEVRDITFFVNLIMGVDYMDETSQVLREAALFSVITCRKCGNKIEADCEKCGECGWENPIVKEGLI